MQGELEATLKQLTGKPVTVIGAGRTDSGVHARGQAAHADVSSQLPLTKIHKALNAILPDEIVVRSVQIAPPKFHARYWAKSKWYRYRIWNDPVRPLFGRERMVHVSDRLNLAAMRRAARKLSGKRDFKVFQSAGSSVQSTVRTVRLKICKEGPQVTIDARGDGFLYHMVRRIAGHLLEIGKGKPPPKIPPTAPARGLCLMEVRY